MKTLVPTSIAIAVGLLVLIGYFIPIESLQVMRNTLVQWAVILTAFALIAGVVNLLVVHWSKIRRRERGGLYSLVLIISLLATLAVVVVFGPTSTWSVWIFDNIQAPVESSLMALLAFVLLFAGIRLLRRRLDLFSILFLVTAILVLLGTAPFFFAGQVPVLSQVRNLIAQVPAAAGARGILLGVSLGILVTGIRILAGSDRPYNG
jgi:peptidoglycan/LPS O-acetylase OafA/YrhL